MQGTSRSLTVLTFLFGFFFGGSVILWANTYVQLNAERAEFERTLSGFKQIGGHRRNIQIESIDREQGVVTANTLRQDLGTRRFAFQVIDDTRIFRQDPIIENGIVVGFTNPQELALADVQVGDIALVRLIVARENAFVATEIAIGSPFARP